MGNVKQETSGTRRSTTRTRMGAGNLAELYTLGEVRLSHRGEDLTAKLGPKHLALLVYLFHEHRPMHPSEVTELLGRGQEEERENEALRRAVTWLRNNVPGVNIRMSAETVEAVGGIWLDTKDVDSAIDGNDSGHVAELYVGEFLDGFESGARAYDEWALRERGRLKRAWSHAMITAARRSEKQNNWESAAQWWQVLVDRAPMRPEPVAGLLRAFATSGREQEAADAYADYLSRLQQSGVSKPAAQVMQVVSQDAFLSRVSTEKGVAVAPPDQAKQDAVPPAARPAAAGESRPAAAEEADSSASDEEGLPAIPGYLPGAAIVPPAPTPVKSQARQNPAADKKAPAVPEPGAAKPPAISKPPADAKPPAASKKPAETKRPAASKAPADAKRPAPSKAPADAKRPAPSKAPADAKRPAASKAPAETKPPTASKAPPEAKRPAASKPPTEAKRPADSRSPKKVDLELPYGRAPSTKRKGSGKPVGPSDPASSVADAAPTPPPRVAPAPRVRRSLLDDDALEDTGPAKKQYVDKKYRPIKHEVTSVRKPWGPFLRRIWDDLEPQRAEALRLLGVAALAVAAALAKVPGITLRILKVVGGFLRAAGLAVWRFIAGAGRAMGRGVRGVVRAVRAALAGVWAGVSGAVRMLGRGLWAVLRSVALVGRLFGASGRGVASAATRAAAGGRRAGKARIDAARARRQHRRAAKARESVVAEPTETRPPPVSKKVVKRRRPASKKAVKRRPAVSDKVAAPEPPLSEPVEAPPLPFLEPPLSEPVEAPAPPVPEPVASAPAAPSVTPARPAVRRKVKPRHWFRAAGRAKEAKRRRAERPSRARLLLFAPAALAVAAGAVFFGPDLYRMVKGVGGALPATLPEVEAPSLPKVTLPKVTVPKVAVPNVAVKTPAFVETSVSKIAEVLAGPLLSGAGQWVLVSDVEVEWAGTADDASADGARPAAAAQAPNSAGGAGAYSPAALTLALESDLVQAGYFSVVPRERALISASGLGGGSSEDLPVTRALAVAQAAGYAAVIDARLRRGSAFDSIAIQVLSPAGDTLFGIAAAVSDSIDALATLTGLSRNVRKRLGEPRGEVDSSLAPARSLTDSPAALNAYAEARRHLFAGRHYYAVQAARDAVERDSTFTLAYRLMAEAYALRGQRSRARTALEAAWLLSERVTERERLRINADRLALDGRLSDAVLAYDELFKRYRDDVGALKSQAVMQRMVGARGRGDGNLRVAYMIDPLDWPQLSRVARYLGYYGRLPNVDSLVAVLKEEAASQ